MPNSHTRRRTKSCETRCAFPPRASCATCKSPTVKPVIPNQKLFNRPANAPRPRKRSEEHTSELQSLMRISYAVFCLKKKKTLIPDVRKNNLHSIHYSVPITYYNLYTQ